MKTHFFPKHQFHFHQNMLVIFALHYIKPMSFTKACLQLDRDGKARKTRRNIKYSLWSHCHNLHTFFKLTKQMQTVFLSLAQKVCLKYKWNFVFKWTARWARREWKVFSGDTGVVLLSYLSTYHPKERCFTQQFWVFFQVLWLLFSPREHLHYISELCKAATLRLSNDKWNSPTSCLQFVYYLQNTKAAAELD